MWAVLVWDAESDGGRWFLRLVTAVDDDVALSTRAVQWPPDAAPPSLLERYDALTTLGYEVVQGGPEAWAWSECLAMNGNIFLAGHAEVRPVVRFAELGK